MSALLDRSRWSTERFGLRSRENESPDFTRWRRDDAGCENETIISFPLSSTSTEGSPFSKGVSAPVLGPTSASQSFVPVPTLGSVSAAQITRSANIPAPLSGTANAVPGYGPVTAVSGLTGTLPAAQIASSSGSLDAVGGIYQLPPSPNSLSSTADLVITLSAATSSSFSSLCSALPGFSGPAVPPGGSATSLVFSSTVTFSAATTFQAGGGSVSLPTQKPSAPNSGYPQAPHSSHNSASSTADPADSSSPFSGIQSTGSSSPPFVPPTSDSSSLVSTASNFGSTGGSTFSIGPSNSMSFPGVLPGSNTMSTGTSASAVFATSNSLSRTFAHNTGAIIGVAVGVAIALLLGILFALCARRRFRKSQNSRLSAPLLHGDDGLNDAYSPVMRRRSNGRNPDFVRPLSFQSVDRGVVFDGMEPIAAHDAENAPYDANNDHYDTDTWSAVPIPALAGPLASNSPSLSPEFYTPSTPSPTLPTPPTPLQPAANPIGAKGFMRRLRLGRPSMASRGLLTTLAPVVENPYSPGPSSVAEISRPPSSQHGSMAHAPSLVSRPSSSFSRPSPSAPPGLALPWIHRRRSGGPEQWDPPATWEV
ncbi:hypothetical protein B0H12DRAFT_40241 [Mycena haematopus]|nr:hypothetical protein B0H12DRAFT_40241 [Mycena haematopus]